MTRPMSARRWLAMVVAFGIAGWLFVVGAVVVLHWIAQLAGLA